MRLIILAASMDDGLNWLDRYMNTPDVDRASNGAVGDVRRDRATIIHPGRYDRLSSTFDPNSPEWLSGGPTKIIRTNAWIFDQRVVSVLHVLNVRHPLCDPTGLLGVMSEEIDERRGWSPDGRTAPMGVMSQRNRPRPKGTPRKSGLTGAGLQLPR